jgi:hypothetical protein
MSSIFNSKPPGPALVAELAARGSTSIGQWHASKVAWVHIMSFASTCDTYGEGMLASNSSNKDNYIANYERPKPGIKSVKVTKQGELGTTRKCSLELQAWNDTQLNAIAKCYFLPGMSVRVQFGWNIDASGANTNGPFTAPYTDSRANCKIFAWTEERTPNFDGFQGKITNYSYSLNSDGGWDITLEIISAANLMAETKIESTTNKCECTTEIDGEEVKLNNNDLAMAIVKVLGDKDSAGPLINSLEGCSEAKDYALVKMDAIARSPFGSVKDGFFDSKQGFVNTFSGAAARGMGTEESYISVQALHEMLNYYSLPSSGKDYVFGKVNTSDVYLSTQGQFGQLFGFGSSDPRVCLLPGADNPVNTKPTTPSAFKGTKVELNRILVNVIFIMKTLKDLSDQTKSEKGINLQTILTAIHTAINNKLGNLWSIEIVDASLAVCDFNRDEPTLQIVDTTDSDAVVEVEIEPIGSYNPRNSIVRDFTLQTKLTDSMKSMALYAYIPNSKSSDPCLDKFKAFTQTNSVKNTTQPTADKATTKGKDIPCESKVGDVECKTVTTSPYQKLFDAWQALKENLTDDNVTAMETARNEYAGSSAEATKPLCNTLLPFEWSFTIDGIGGFKFGQYITHPRIPAEIRSVFKFQVTSVEHDISENDWKTTVNTIARYRKQ